MLETTPPDAAQTSETLAPGAKKPRKRRRTAVGVKARPERARADMAVMAAKPARVAATAAAAVPVSDAMAGVDAFGKVNQWSLFAASTRNARKAHDEERASRLRDNDAIRGQAELVAEAARAFDKLRMRGIAGAQAGRDAVSQVWSRKRAAEAQAARALQEKEALARATGTAAPEAELHGAPSEIVHRTESSGGADL